MAETCVFNAYITCPKADRKCGKCGWNPEVEEKRKGAVKGNG